MKSFIVKFSELIKLERPNQLLEYNFNSAKRKLLIPLYQREYKWTADKVRVLIKDIADRDKFLGNIILDEMECCYEIVDGQQRLTTAFLVFMALYNCYDDIGAPDTQRTILDKIKINEQYFLKNESVGNFVNILNNRMQINITTDVYAQKETFNRSFEIIYEFLKKQENEALPTYKDRLRTFLNKLLDCRFLVFINEHSDHSRTAPIEQVFLDINFKNQRLDAEDVFKGYCFKNYNGEHTNELKELWVKLKKCGKYFEQFGYSDLSKYLYNYFISDLSLRKITKELSIEKEHYLEGKTLDDTKSILNELILYGESISKYFDGLNKDEDNYLFEEICPDAINYKNTHNDKQLKEMSKFIIGYTSAQYQKFPFFTFIDLVSRDNLLKTILTYMDFKKIVTNLYIYAFLFVYSAEKKDKTSIDDTIFQILHGKEIVDEIETDIENEDKIRKVVVKVRDLRRKLCDEFHFQQIFKEDLFFKICNVIDEYDANANFIKKIYTTQNLFTVEHLIINKNKKVVWKNNANNPITIKIIDRDNNIKKTINYLVLPGGDEGLNGRLESFDIVTKIEKIKEYYQRDGIPNHVGIYINKIESLASYQALVRKKGTEVDKSEVEAIYSAFIEEYFEDLVERDLLTQLETAFQEAFQQHT